MSEWPCPFEHTDVDTLYNVTPMAIEDLPTKCTWCHQPITYAGEVAFVDIPEPVPVPGVMEFTKIQFSRRVPGVMEVTKVPNPPPKDFHDK